VSWLAAAVGIDDASFIALAGYNGSAALSGYATAVGIDDATRLLPETTQKVRQLGLTLRDLYVDETGLPILARPGLSTQDRRRGEDHSEEEDEDDALRKGETSHEVLSEAAPGRTGVGRAGASPENGVAEGE